MPLVSYASPTITDHQTTWPVMRTLPIVKYTMRLYVNSVMLASIRQLTTPAVSSIFPSVQPTSMTHVHNVIQHIMWGTTVTTALIILSSVHHTLTLSARSVTQLTMFRPSGFNATRIWNIVRLMLIKLVRCVLAGIIRQRICRNVTSMSSTVKSTLMLNARLVSPTSILQLTTLHVLWTLPIALPTSMPHVRLVSVDIIIQP